MKISPLCVPECDAAFKIFEDMFFTGVIGPVDNFTAELEPEEYRLVSGAVCKRRCEFSTGRYFAKHALTSIGADSKAPILCTERGQPEWPYGIVGSISHTADMSIVGVTQRHHVQSLGLDIEVRDGLSPELYRDILTSIEIAQLPTWERQLSAAPTLLFSAKESVYKAVNPLVGTMIGFDEMEIELDLDRRSFLAKYRGQDNRNSIAESGLGRFQKYNQFVITAFAILSI